MREKLPRSLKEQTKSQVKEAESSGFLEGMLKKFSKVSPALAFLVALHSMGIKFEREEGKEQKDEVTLVAHLESSAGGDLETREVPPHEISLETNINYEWSGRDFGRVEAEGGERGAVEAQLRGIVEQELATYREEGIDPSKAIENIRVNTEAFSDASGARTHPERNQELSQARAELANEILREILQEYGFSAEQIQTQAEGGGTEGDLLEFSGALAQLGFRTNAGSPEAMRNEAQRIIDALNQGRDSEVIRLTHGMPLEAVRQVYEQNVAAHRHANVSIRMETVGLKIIHDAGQPPRVIEAVRSTRAEDTSVLLIERPIYLNEEPIEQPRFLQTSGQLRDPGKEPDNIDPESEPAKNKSESDEDWPEITIDTEGGLTEADSDETKLSDSDSPPRKNRAHRRAEASHGRKQAGRNEANGTNEQPRAIRLRINRTLERFKARKEREWENKPNRPAKIISRPVKKPRYRAFPGGPGTLAS